jgi:DNA-binding transcriptional LysR family regulator
VDRLHCLKIFAEVARNSSFAEAAQRLGMSRAGVSKHVAWLEESMGAQLLQRTTKQVNLTEAGLRVLENGLMLLDRYDEIEADVRNSVSEPRGVVRVGTPPSFGARHLLPVVARFTELHPDIQVFLSLDDGRANLVSEGLDLSVRIAPALQDASYRAHLLMKAPQVLVAAPAYLKRVGNPKTLQDLTQHNCLVHTLKFPTNIWRFNGPDGQASIRVRGPICSNFGDTLHNAAVLGHGISVHPYYMVSDDLAAGRLVVVLPDWEPTELDIYVTYSTRQKLPVRVRALLDFLREWARSAPEWSEPVGPVAAL